MRGKSGFITINGHLKCVGITPTENTTKQVSGLETVAFRMNKAQATEWAAALTDAAAKLEKIVITGKRKRQRDGMFPATVGGYQNWSSRGRHSDEDEDFF